MQRYGPLVWVMGMERESARYHGDLFEATCGGGEVRVSVSVC